MFGRSGSDPRPIFPAIGQYYQFTSDLAYLVVRVSAGLFIFLHGWIKLTTMTHAGLTGYLAKLGLEPSGSFAYYLVFNETLVALLLIVGLFTRLAALSLGVEFIVLIVLVHVPRGWGAAVNGTEFPLFWLLMLIAVLLRGGGPYSLDRKIGKEL